MDNPLLPTSQTPPPPYHLHTSNIRILQTANPRQFQAILDTLIHFRAIRGYSYGSASLTFEQEEEAREEREELDEEEMNWKEWLKILFGGIGIFAVVILLILAMSS